MDKMPKVSVIMGIYNCSNYLPKAIESIVNQTYTNWELILCDDASTDDTYEIAKEYAEKYLDKIILLRNEVNSKLSFTLNHCLEHATGEYVARMDADDLCVPERFEKQVEFLNEHQDIALVGTSMQRFSDEGLADILYALEKPDRYSLRSAMPFFHATIMMRKSAYDALGGYTVSKRTARGQDYDMWFRFYALGLTGANLQEPLYLVREDKAAIRRRTFKTRWNAYKTTRYGFKLLKYPKRWIIKPTLIFVFKSLCPYWIQDKYRAHQKRKFEAKKDK